MSLSLSYVQGPNNTISVADSEGIFLGFICTNPFGVLSFHQEQALSIQEHAELCHVMQQIHIYIGA
jgi:hypothetical protein